MADKSLYNLLISCAERQIAASEFLNLYREFCNQEFFLNAEIDENNEDQSVINKSFESIASDLIKVLNAKQNHLLADYVLHVLFVNYNSEVIRAFFPKIHLLTNERMLLYFFSKSCAFLSKLADKLIIDQLSHEIVDSIIPETLNINIESIKKELLVSIARFLHLSLKFLPYPVELKSQESSDKLYSLLNKLSQVDKLQHKILLQSIEARLIIQHTEAGAADNVTSPFNDSPSITSPQYVPSPSTASKQSVPNDPNFANYKDVKLLRYYKNIWLNNKINNWEAMDDTFLSSYSAISTNLLKSPNNMPVSMEEVLSDLTETAFTSFAQFVSNSQYHQRNSSMNLLERKWIFFITKQLPLLIFDHGKSNESIAEAVVKALEKIDDKVLKALKSYISEKDNVKSGDEDLFDDSPVSDLDIRHDFIKNLIMLNLQPSSSINKFLRDDQSIDISSLVTNDDLTINNAQFVQETVKDIKTFFDYSLKSLELENITNISDSSQVGIKEVFLTFDTLPPTKQREISERAVQILSESSTEHNVTKFTKLCALMACNYSHSLTVILSMVKPEKLMEPLLNFIDKVTNLNENSNGVKIPGSSNDFTSHFLPLNYSTLLILTIIKTYDISLVDIFLRLKRNISSNSFMIDLISKTSDIDETFTINTTTTDNEGTKDISAACVNDWFKYIFENGTNLDVLVPQSGMEKTISVIPYIFKQVIYGIEMGSVTDLSKIINGIENLLHPQLALSLIKIFFWITNYVPTLKSNSIPDDIVQKLFMVISALIIPATLHSDLRVYHDLLVKLISPDMLKAMYKFRVQSHSNYGIYSSEAQGSPVVETLIPRFVNSLNFSPVYNFDFNIISTETSYTQKQVNFNSFSLSNEDLIDKILSNQINSFWSLHSSTYYNIDYLNTVISIIGPKKFLTYVFETLDYKMQKHGVSGSRNKTNGFDVEQVKDYVFYFMILHDTVDRNEVAQLISWLNCDESANEEFKVDIQLNTSSAVKLEQQPSQDDDFDMLFGENETSVPGEQEEEFVSIQSVESPKFQSQIAALKRNTFAYVLQKVDLTDNQVSGLNKQPGLKQSSLKEYHQRYLSVLKTCVF